MAPTWQEREQAFEAKYAHDEEFRFRVTARRDKLFARWIASRAGLQGEEAEALTKSVLAIMDGKQHDSAVLDYARTVLAQRGMHAPDKELGTALAECGQHARQQLLEAPLGSASS